ncbi:MAG: macro domain-containing protein [Legionellales bacterium]|nr:macro domain-containing protein [Legionellales bacterium]
MKFLYIKLIFFTVICLNVNAKYQDQVEIFYKAGKRHIGRVSMLLPIKQKTNHLLFLNPILMRDSNSASEGNLGLGYRFMFRNNQIIGSYLYYDIRKTTNNNLINQATFGIEYLRESVEFRANGYLPIIKDKFTLSTTKKNNQLTHDSSNIYLESSTTTVIERAFRGLDSEIGFTSRNLKLNLFLGGYLFKAENVTIVGPQIRLEYKPLSWLTISTEVKQDKVRGLDYYGGISIRTPMLKFNKNISPYSIHSKMTQIPVRDVDIVDQTKEDRVITKKTTFSIAHSKTDLGRFLAEGKTHIIIAKDINFGGDNVNFDKFTGMIFGMDVSMDDRGISRIAFKPKKLYNYNIPARKATAPRVSISINEENRVSIDSPTGFFNLIKKSEIGYLILDEWSAVSDNSAGLGGHIIDSSIHHIENRSDLSKVKQGGVAVLGSGETVFSDIVNKGKIAGTNIGGTVSIITDKVLVYNCSNYGKFTKGTKKSGGNVYAGYYKVKIINALNAVDIDGENNGGIIHRTGEQPHLGAEGVRVENCKSIGNIFGNDNAGVIYRPLHETVVDGNKYVGKIYGLRNAGVVGKASGSKVTNNLASGGVYGVTNAPVFYKGEYGAEIKQNISSSILFGSRGAGLGIIADCEVVNNKFTGYIIGYSNSSTVIKAEANSVITDNVINTTSFGRKNKQTSIITPSAGATIRDNTFTNTKVDAIKTPYRKFSLERKLEISANGNILSQDVDAIVNSRGIAGGGGGLDGVIRGSINADSIGDLNIYNDTGGLEDGNFAITRAINTNSKYVIWGLGPNYDNSTPDTIKQSKLALEAFYGDCLRFAARNGMTSIAFPSIGTGAGGYPLQLAADTAVNVSNDIQTKYGYDIDIKFALITAASRPLYQTAISNLP